MSDIEVWVLPLGVVKAIINLTYPVSGAPCAEVVKPEMALPEAMAEFRLSM